MKRTAAIIYNGGNIYVWHLLWMSFTSLLTFVIYVIVITLLALFQAKYTQVNPMIWIPEVFLMSVQNSLTVSTI